MDSRMRRNCNRPVYLESYKNSNAFLSSYLTEENLRLKTTKEIDVNN